MPCGLIYSAAALAAGAGSAIKGALLMAVFGALTAIPVAGTGVLAGSLGWLRRPAWKALAALLCLGLALAIAWQALSGGHGGGHAGHGTQAMPATPHSHHAH
jgi:sulfite exporter TauE/SafE